MQILVLGGTRFVGRHLVAAALAAGHAVTVFHRGRTGRDLFPEAEHLLGDRAAGESGLKSLAGRRWDVVFDVSGYLPRLVDLTTALLRDAVGRYVFVSSVAAYASPDATTEGSPLRPALAADYGGLKVGCERAVHAAYSERALVVRPGFIVGPHDPLPRLPRLLRRFDTTGDRLAGRPEQPVQLLDARDLARFLLHATAGELQGTFNLTGDGVTMDRLIDEVRRATGGGARPVWAGDTFLERHGVAPVDGVAFWFPRRDEGLQRTPNRSALDHGLTLRPLADSIRDTLVWLRRPRRLFSDWSGWRRPTRPLLTLRRERSLLRKLQG